MSEILVELIELSTKHNINCTLCFNKIGNYKLTGEKKMNGKTIHLIYDEPIDNEKQKLNTFLQNKNSIKIDKKSKDLIFNIL